MGQGVPCSLGSLAIPSFQGITSLSPQSRVQGQCLLLCTLSCLSFAVATCSPGPSPDSPAAPRAAQRHHGHHALSAHQLQEVPPAL